jgi:hypothetical protein
VIALQMKVFVCANIHPACDEYALFLPSSSQDMFNKSQRCVCIVVQGHPKGLA